MDKLHKELQKKFVLESLNKMLPETLKKLFEESQKIQSIFLGLSQPYSLKHAIPVTLPERISAATF